MHSSVRDLHRLQRDGFENIALSYFHILLGTVSNSRGVVGNMISTESTANVGKSALLYKICNTYLQQTGNTEEAIPHYHPRGANIIFSEKIAQQINSLLNSELYKQAIHAPQHDLFTGDEAFSYLVGVFIEHFNGTHLWFHNNSAKFYQVHNMLIACSSRTDVLTTETRFGRPIAYSISFNTAHALLPAIQKAIAQLEDSLPPLGKVLS